MKKGVRLRLVKNIHLEIIYTENLKERIFYISYKTLKSTVSSISDLPTHPRLKVEWKEWSEIIYGRVCREIESRRGVLKAQKREYFFLNCKRQARNSVSAWRMINRE